MDRAKVMKRVMVIGSSGSGKSTLARQLGVVLGLEVVHLDALYWQSGWVEAPHEERCSILKPELERERWVTDGNYSVTWPARTALADTIVFLDMPRWLCVWRVVWRSLHYRGRTRPDLPPGCPERPLATIKELVPYIWCYPANGRRKALAFLESHRDDKTVIVLRGPKAVRRFLANFRS